MSRYKVVYYLLSTLYNFRPPPEKGFVSKTDIVDGGPVKWTKHEPETEAAERELIRELLYVFQGIEGSILQRNGDGGFSVSPDKRECYSPSTMQLALRLAELGWLYNSVHTFIDKCNSQKGLGLCGQSLVTGLREELADYYRLLSLLEDQLKSKRTVQDEGKCSVF